MLSDTAPTGVKDADPAFWVLRLDALRLANRADAFDEAAVEEHLARSAETAEPEQLACGCPSAMVQTLKGEAAAGAD